MFASWSNQWVDIHSFSSGELKHIEFEWLSPWSVWTCERDWPWVSAVTLNISGRRMVKLSILFREYISWVYNPRDFFFYPLLFNKSKSIEAGMWQILVTSLSILLNSSSLLPSSSSSSSSSFSSSSSSSSSSPSSSSSASITEAAIIITTTKIILQQHTSNYCIHCHWFRCWWPVVMLQTPHPSSDRC